MSTEAEVPEIETEFPIIEAVGFETSEPIGEPEENLSVEVSDEELIEIEENLTREEKLIRLKKFKLSVAEQKENLIVECEKSEARVRLSPIVDKWRQKKNVDLASLCKGSALSKGFVCDILKGRKTVELRKARILIGMIDYQLCKRFDVEYFS